RGGRHENSKNHASVAGPRVSNRALGTRAVERAGRMPLLRKRKDLRAREQGQKATSLAVPEVPSRIKRDSRNNLPPHAYTAANLVHGVSNHARPGCEHLECSTLPRSRPAVQDRLESSN